MPTRNGQPSRLQNFFGRIVDAAAKGNNYNPQTGQYSNVGKGLLARTGQVAAGLINPALGAAVGQAGENWVNNGNPLNFQGNDSRLGQLVNAFMGNNGEIGGITRDTFRPDSRLNIPGYGAVTLPAVNAVAPTEQPWQSLGTGTGNVFSGGDLGAWATPQQQPRTYGQSGGSFTPWGAGVIQNDRFGDAARSFGIGAGSGGSAGAFALADAMAANKKNRD